MIRQADVADTELSAIDERIGDKLAALPEVAYASGMGFVGTFLPDSGAMFIMFGLAPNDYAIRQYRIIEGEKLTGNRQIMLGDMMAEALHMSVGDTVEVSGNRYRVVGIYKGDAGWQEMGGIVRDAAQEGLGQVRENAAEYYEQGRSKVHDVVCVFEQFVRQQPFMSLLIAAGVGWLLGRFWRRS